MALLGDPALPFKRRFNLTLTRLCTFMDFFAPVLVLAVWLRCRDFISFPSRCFLASIAAASLVDLAWLRSCQHLPDGGSYASWRELLAIGFKVGVYGLGPGCEIVEAFMQGLDPAAISSHAAAARLLFAATRVEGALLMWLARPARITRALPAHAVVTIHSLSWNPRMCAAAAVNHPAAQRTTQAAYRLLGALRFHLLPPVAAPAQPAPPAEQCCVVMSHCQLALGFFLPAVAQALMESSLFAWHQQQRQQLGLPPEQGWQASLHASLHAFFADLDAYVALVAAWVLLGVVFDASQLVCATSGGAGQ